MIDISKYYYDPKFGLSSADKLYQKLKKIEPTITLKEVKAFVNKQFAAQVSKPIRKPKEYSTIVAPSVGNNYQMDIMVYDRYAYNSYRYILVIVDVYSRYALARAMTNRTMPTIMKNIKEIFDEMGIPKNINADNEFNTKEFNKYAEQHGIITHYSQPDEINKNAIVERLNRTIAELIQKWRISSGRYDWNKILPKIMDNYNTNYHKTIKTTPYDVFFKNDINLQDIKKIIHKYTIGDQVRLRIEKKVFGKADELTYSKDIYLINKIKGNKIYVTNSRTGVDVKEHFKPYQLKPVGEIQYKENIEQEHEPVHKETQKERKMVRVLNKEGIKKNEVAIKRNLRERKPNQLEDVKYGKIVY